MTLEDAFDPIADTGATGYECLRSPWRSIDQVRRQHVWLRQLEGEFDEGRLS